MSREVLLAVSVTVPTSRREARFALATPMSRLRRVEAAGHTKPMPLRSTKNSQFPNGRRRSISLGITRLAGRRTGGASRGASGAILIACIIQQAFHQLPLASEPLARDAMAFQAS